MNTAQRLTLPLLWALAALPASAVPTYRPADVDLLSYQARVSLNIGGRTETRYFNEPFDTQLERNGLGRLRVQAQAEGGGGVLAYAESDGGRVLADFNTAQTFSFNDLSQLAVARFFHTLSADVYLTTRQPGAQGTVGYSLALFAPDGRTLMRHMWTGATVGNSKAWLEDVGLVTFTPEVGVYRLEVEGVANINVPAGAARSYARIVPFVNVLVSPVPEASSWALLVCGLGIIGIARHLRVSRRREALARV